MNWNCSKCTFINHPDLNTCEICETKKTDQKKSNSSNKRSNYNFKPSGRYPLPSMCSNKHCRYNSIKTGNKLCSKCKYDEDIEGYWSD